MRNLFNKILKEYWSILKNTKTNDVAIDNYFKEKYSHTSKSIWVGIQEEVNSEEILNYLDDEVLKYSYNQKLYKKGKKMKEIIELLKSKNLKVSTMESCTGGGVANALTNIEGSSEVFDFGAVTYSNAYKVKMGVDAQVIEKYSVYSRETAREMSRAISYFTESDYGIGITGKLNRQDLNNPSGKDNLVYISIYDRKKNTYQEEMVEVKMTTRKEDKDQIISTIQKIFLDILKN